MGRHSKERQGQQDSVLADQAGEHRAAEVGRPWWRKRALRAAVAAVAALVIAPLVVNLGNNLIDRLTALPVPPPVPSSAQSQHNSKRKATRSATPASTSAPDQKPAPKPKPKPKPLLPSHPLTVLSEDPIDPGNVVWTFRSSHVLNGSRLSYINHDKDAYQANWLNDYLFNLHGYAPYSDTRFVLEDNYPYNVQLIDMQVANKSCGSPPTGTLVDAPDGVSDLATQVGFDLASQDNDAMLARGPNVKDWRAGYFWHHTVVLKPGQARALEVRAVAPNRACSFVYQVTVALPNSSEMSQTISDGGQPFRVSSPSSSHFSAKYRPGTYDFSRYKAVFVGGVADPKNDGRLVRERPRAGLAGLRY
jgi:hypothetical protein